MVETVPAVLQTIGTTWTARRRRSHEREGGEATHAREHYGADRQCARRKETDGVVRLIPQENPKDDHRAGVGTDPGADRECAKV